jgi:hypothetical protein
MLLSAAMRAGVQPCWQSTATSVSRSIPAVLASRGGGKMASAGCRCKRGVGAVAVEVRILCRSASTALVAGGVGNGM